MYTYINIFVRFKHLVQFDFSIAFNYKLEVSQIIKLDGLKLFN